jgi:mRNA interferase RelE/StbE
MELLFDESFEKSIKKLKDKKLKEKIRLLITEFDKADVLTQITNIKKIVGYETYYRARINDYRIGFELIKPNTIVFILVAHRKDIYKHFP